MEQENVTERQISFLGEGGKFFGIYIVNLLLTIVTLGLYYPWAKAAKLVYLYQETEFAGSRFSFHGTGKEMFIGFIKAIAIFIVVYGIFMACTFTQNPVFIFIGFAFFYLSLLFLIPLAIHGSIKYRASRSSWRGIHFGYRGNRNELLKEFIISSLLTLVTFGFYGFWLAVNIRKYVIGNIRFGNVKFSFEGEGMDYFLSIITLGIYTFWYMKDIFNFNIENMKMEQNGKPVHFKSSATGGRYFELLFVNLLLIVFTLGLGTPWAIIRSVNFVFNNVVIDGDFDTNAIEQTEADYKNATGDDMLDVLDIGLV